MAFLVKKLDGTCGRYHAAGFGPQSEYIMLRGGVGKGGQNLAAEVDALRKALNRLPAGKGGTISNIPETGPVDDTVIQAILRFKSMNVPEDKAPLMKHPMRATVVLNELVLASKQLVQTNAEIVPMLKSLIGDAESCIRAATVNIDMAEASLNGASMFGAKPEDGMRLLNRHFRMDLMPNRRQAIDFVALIFARMGQVFRRPGDLWGASILDFDPNPPTSGVIAYTSAGGFFRAGELDSGKRQDSIYLCELMRLTTRDTAVQSIVHELAHFCGPKTGEIIDDPAYGQPDAPKMQRLTPYQRLHNAECYGNYAFECKNGRDPAGMV